MDRQRDGDHARRLHTAQVFAIVAPLVAALYVLSVGPAVMLRDGGRISQDTFLLIYATFILLTYFSPTNQVLEWYLSLWSN